MRLVCPNCGAQYEVDDRVIPDNGRDVQCSSCGHAWYQMPAHLQTTGEPETAEPDAMADADDDTATELEAEGELEDAPEPVADAEPPAEIDTAAAEPEPAAEAPQEAPAEAVEPAAEPEPTAEAEPEPEAAAESEAEDEGAPAEDAPAAEAPPKRDLDESLRAILQEEAAREMEARAADREPQAEETAADLAPEATPDAAEVRPDTGAAPSTDLDDDVIPDISDAEDTGLEAGAMAGAAGAAVEGAKAPRRDLFPDIEEINSTLDSHGLPEEEVDEEEEIGRSGFSRGFFAVIFIAALALALYLVAPRLAISIPALEPVLSAYVGAVNSAREWLDGMVQGLTGRIDGSDQP